MSLFLTTIIPFATSVKTTDSSRIFILAIGDDIDVPGAKTFIVGAIEFDKVSGESSGHFHFQTQIYDESGDKVYTIKGMLKDGAVQVVPYHYCPVRNIIWTNLSLVMGEGMVKTTDTIIENFEYRGQSITLPNTGGKYIPVTIAMLVSPTGEYLTLDGKYGGVWGDGGWVYAGIPNVFGGVSYLKIFMEK